MGKIIFIAIFIACTWSIVACNYSRCVLNQHRKLINCRGENWTRIPYDYLQGKKFHTLDLGVNNISSLADTSTFFELSAKDRIEAILLDHNQISDLPHHLFDALSNLRFLDLSNNNLKHVPRRLCHMTNLQELVLDRNPIESVSKNAFRCLRHLEFLSMANTKLRRLPDDFLKDSPLRELNLSGNDIVNIHEVSFPVGLKIVPHQLLMSQRNLHLESNDVGQ